MQATGARDYGEDVAERNLGENGVDVTSAAVVAFYEKQRAADSALVPLPKTNIHLQPRIEEFKLRKSGGRVRTMSMDAKSILSTTATVNSRCDSGLGMRDGAITPTRPGKLKRTASLRVDDRRGRPWISTESPQSEKSTRAGLTDDSGKESLRSASPPAIPRYRLPNNIYPASPEPATVPVPDRHSSLFQGTYTCSTPTTEYSDYASTNGRPQSRHTAMTSFDSMRKIADGDAERPQIIHAAPVITSVKAATPTNSEIMEVRELECLTTDYSDADSFTEKRRQILYDDESLLFKDGFGDLGDKLPGIAGEGDGDGDVFTEKTYNFWQSRRARLRALGFDYDSDESDEQLRPATAPAPSPKNRVVTGGRLRRVVRLDKKIDEGSEEEEMPYVAKVRRAKIVRAREYLDDEGNTADVE